VATRVDGVETKHIRPVRQFMLHGSTATVGIFRDRHSCIFRH